MALLNDLTAPDANTGRRRQGLSIRAVLLTWRQSVRQLRAGHVDDSGRGVHDLTGRALSLLSELELGADGGDAGLLSQLQAARHEMRSYYRLTYPP